MKSAAGNHEVYATALRRSSSDGTLIQKEILKLRSFAARHVDNKWDCAGLIREFGTTWLG